MSRLSRALALLLLTALLLPLTLVSAQDGGAVTGPNLLYNPGFEGFYQSYRYGPSIEDLVLEFRIADGWNPWFRQQSPEDPAWRNRRPEYRPSSYNYNGTAAQQFFTSFSTHEAGLWQQVTNATPGETYRFSIAAYVWSSMGEDLFHSERPGGVALRVGIDPTGGGNPYAETVAWSLFSTFYDEWRVLSVDTVAQSNAVTVFVWSQHASPATHNDIALDEAFLGTIDPSAAVVVEAATGADTTSEAAEEAAPAEESVAADTPADEPAAADQAVTGAPSLVSAVPLRVRARPYARAVDLLPAGTRVPVLGRNSDGNYALVEYNGQQGWVASWLADFSVEFETLPVLP